MYLFSIRLSKINEGFMKKYLLKHKENKNAFINNALDIFRKYNLQKELIAFAQSDEKENKELAEMAMDDYLKLINEY